MRAFNHLRQALSATAAVALCLGPIAAQAQDSRSRARIGTPAGSQRPSLEVRLSVGEGELITLPSDVANVWTSNPGAADVYVNNTRQIYLYGKEFGESTIFATNARGAVIYSARVMVSQNITSIDRMLKVAMPDADIKVTIVGQIAVLTGTVASPDDSATAQRLVTSILNPGIDVSAQGAMLKIVPVNRLKTATPLQVNLQVRIAEVSRSFVKNIGANVLTRDLTGGFKLGISSGSRVPGTIGSVDTSALPMLDASSRFGFPAGTLSLPYDPRLGDFVFPGTGTSATTTKGTQFSTVSLLGKLFGLDALAALDLGERIGQVTTLAQPNLTALSGETATFLAGGEIPIPVPQTDASGGGTITIQYKQYGVSLGFSPTVLSDGRISMRVRPEVSELSSTNAVQIAGMSIPAISTRRVETSVELGSGESFMIAGLLSNQHNNVIDKVPGAGDVPILGALFRSNAFQRNETELVVVITPYLVKPVNANQIVLPTDGYKAPDDLKRVFLGQLSDGTSGGDRPKPSMETPPNNAPAVGALSPAPMLGAPQQLQAARPEPQQKPQRNERREEQAQAPAPAQKKKKTVASAMPGFGQ